MDSLLSDASLGPELFKLLEAKLKQTTADLEKESQRNSLLQTELEALRDERETLIDSAGGCSCKDVGNVVIVRDDDDHLLEEQATKIGSLEQSLSQLRDECARRTTEVKIYRQALAATRKEFNFDLAITLASLPQPVQDVPLRDTLVPCLSKRWKDPAIAFPAEGRAVCPPGNTLFLNQRIFWYFADDVHGIALAPSALYRPSDQIWTANDEFTYLLNETKEVFYRGPSHYICYAGTFQCAYTGELPSVDFKKLPAAIKEELIRTSFSRPEMAGVPGERGRLRKLYTDGERKVAFLALQCVGFNQKLYDALLAARPPQLREVEQGSTGSAAKRRRQEETNTGRAAKMMKGGDRSETEASGDELMI